MLPWKQKVSEKISHLFSDSSDPHSPAALRNSQVRSFSQGKSFSSMFSYILPSSSSDRSRSDKDRDDDMPIQSPSVKWNSPSTYQPLDRDDKEFDHACENKETPISHGEDREHGSGRSIECENKGPLRSIKCENKGINHEVEDPGSWRSTSSSDMFEDAMDQHDGERAMPYLTEESSFISANLYEFLLSALPNIVKGCQWVLLYSTVKHGISLRTLIRRSGDLPGPCLLIVGDKHGAVFGGLLECPLKPTPKRKYQGTNQTFVFTTIYGAPRLFRPTGANRYFYLCLNDLLALGGGGNFALCLDGDLMNGTSGPCETFGNLCLAHSQEFELKNVELWGFAHSSRYLN